MRSPSKYSRSAFDKRGLFERGAVIARGRVITSFVSSSAKRLARHANKTGNVDLAV
jgi:hypothetical protein